MNSNKPLRFILATVAMGLFSMLTMCKKGDKILNADATVINMGDPASDGCGWWIKIDSTLYYKPKSLAASFQKNNLKVNISYIVLDTKYHCGHTDKETGPIEIDIKNIAEKN
jgi:hypothetical protein